MTTINMQLPYVSGQGGDDGAGSDSFNKAGGYSPYRTRGSIDINLNRLPVSDDITFAVPEAIVINDAFVCSSAGTPFSGVIGATAVNPGDYLVYNGGGPTTAGNWVAIANPDYTANLRNCPPRFVRIISSRLPGVG